MRYFYIDFENRKVDGLNGISSLDENDIIKIYYSKDASTITFGLHRRLMESKAEIMYEKIDDAIKKNDFHNNLMSSLKDHDVVKQIYNCEYMEKYKNLLE